MAASLSGLSAWMQSATAALLAELRRRGYRVTVYSGRRSYLAQLKRYVAGHTTVPPGESKHEKGQAVDLIIEPSSGYRVAGAIWTKLGGLWGGNFKNKALAAVEFQHFEERASSQRTTSSSSRPRSVGSSRISARGSGAGAGAALARLRAANRR